MAAFDRPLYYICIFTVFIATKARLMNKTTNLLFSIAATLLFSCQQKEDNRTHYRAVNGKDTAQLSITVYDDRFYGRYEMIYGKNGKDSGTVRGQIIGDTLKGEFKYISFGGTKSISPIQFLKKDGKLRLGKGLKATYMGIPFYVKEVPMDYDTGFVLEVLHP